MSSIFTSSIGKKLIMSISGCFLVLFLIFHMVMNSVLVFSDDAYNAICGFLGGSWYAIAGTMVLALGVAVHILYATILTIQNRRARGKNRYAVTAKGNGVEWSSKNMFVLGVVVIIGLLIHFYNFWYNMMFVEIIGQHENRFGFHPADGAALVRFTFSHVEYVVIYIVWMVALWFHLTHGIWSMLHTVGWNNTVWMNRVKWISYVVSTLIILVFIAVVVIIYIQGIM